MSMERTKGVYARLTHFVQNGVRPSTWDGYLTFRSGFIRVCMLGGMVTPNGLLVGWRAVSYWCGEICSRSLGASTNNFFITTKTQTFAVGSRTVATLFCIRRTSLLRT